MSQNVCGMYTKASLSANPSFPMISTVTDVDQSSKTPWAVHTALLFYETPASSKTDSNHDEMPGSTPVGIFKNSSRSILPSSLRSSLRKTSRTVPAGAPWAFAVSRTPAKRSQRVVRNVARAKGSNVDDSAPLAATMASKPLLGVPGISGPATSVSAPSSEPEAQAEPCAPIIGRSWEQPSLRVLGKPWTPPAHPCDLRQCGRMERGAVMLSKHVNDSPYQFPVFCRERAPRRAASVENEATSPSQRRCRSASAGRVATCGDAGDTRMLRSHAPPKNHASFRPSTIDLLHAYSQDLFGAPLTKSHDQGRNIDFAAESRTSPQGALRAEDSQKSRAGVVRERAHMAPIWTIAFFKPRLRDWRWPHGSRPVGSRPQGFAPTPKPGS